MKDFIKKLKKFFGYVDTEEYLDYASNLKHDYDKVCKVIDSCTSMEQLNTALNMIILYCNKYEHSALMEAYRNDIFKRLETKSEKYE